MEQQLKLLQSIIHHLSAGKIFSFFGTFWVAKKDAHWLSIPITKSEPGLLEYEPS
jgi:hypothetical protein